MVSKIITCFGDYFANIYEQNKPRGDEPSVEGDQIIFYVCMAVNCCLVKYYSRRWSKTFVKPA